MVVTVHPRVIPKASQYLGMARLGLGGKFRQVSARLGAVLSVSWASANIDLHGWHSTKMEG